MKEIKFRQFIDGKFHYWGFIAEGIFSGPIHDDKGYPDSQQFTGLRDKNEKEIYEGDIVKSGLLKLNGKVVYQKNCFTVQCKDGMRQWILFEQDVEVIGNIHENSELLK